MALMLTSGKVHTSGAGWVRRSGSRQHLSGAYFWPVPTRRAETSGSGAPCGITSGRVRPCISLAPCLCRPSVGDVGIVHVGAGPVALPALLARRPAAYILRAPSRPDGSQCATGSGVREFGGGAPAAALYGIRAERSRRLAPRLRRLTVLTSPPSCRLRLTRGRVLSIFRRESKARTFPDARPLIHHGRGRRYGVKAKAADRRGEAAFTPRRCPAYPAAQGANHGRA